MIVSWNKLAILKENVPQLVLILIMYKEIATHSNIHAWKTPWTEEPDGLQSMESQKSGT